jgi:hypothetical protein
MSTPARAISPNDPRLTQQLIEHDSPEPIQSAQALRLLSYSLTAKARALEDCETYCYVMRCPNGHTWPVSITCHQRFCPHCHERITMQLIKKYEAIDIGAEPFLLVEISWPGNLCRGAVQVFNSHIGKGFKALERSSTGPIGTVWNTVPSLGRLTAYLLLWGDDVQSFERYRAAWPMMNVRVSSRPAHQFQASLHQIFDHAPSKDPLFRADCEYFFHGRRSVHTMGTLHMRERSPLESATSPGDPDELFPSEQETGNNSGSDYPHKCPQCHLPASGISQRMHRSDYGQSRIAHAYQTIINRE